MGLQHAAYASSQSPAQDNVSRPRQLGVADRASGRCRRTSHVTRRPKAVRVDRSRRCPRVRGIAVVAARRCRSGTRRVGRRHTCPGWVRSRQQSPVAGRGAVEATSASAVRHVHCGVRRDQCPAQSCRCRHAVPPTSSGWQCIHRRRRRSRRRSAASPSASQSDRRVSRRSPMPSLQIDLFTGCWMSVVAVGCNRRRCSVASGRTSSVSASQCSCRCRRCTPRPAGDRIDGDQRIVAVAVTVEAPSHRHRRCSSVGRTVSVAVTVDTRGAVVASRACPVQRTCRCRRSRRRTMNPVHRRRPRRFGTGSGCVAVHAVGDAVAVGVDDHRRQQSLSSVVAGEAFELGCRISRRRRSSLPGTVAGPAVVVEAVVRFSRCASGLERAMSVSARRSRPWHCVVDEAVQVVVDVVRPGTTPCSRCRSPSVRDARCCQREVDRGSGSLQSTSQLDRPSWSSVVVLVVESC